MSYTSGSTASEPVTGISTEASPEIVSEPRTESSTSEIVPESRTDPFTSKTSTASESVTTYSTQDFTTKNVETELTSTSMPSTTTKDIIDSTTEIFGGTSGTQNPPGTSATKFTVPPRGTSSITTAAETDKSTDTESTMFSTAGSNTEYEFVTETRAESSTSQTASKPGVESFTSEPVSDSSTISDDITKYSTPYSTKMIETESITISTPSTTTGNIIDFTEKFIDWTSGPQNQTATSVTNFTSAPQGNSSIVTASETDTSADTDSTTMFSTARSTTEYELVTETRVEASTFEPVSESSTTSDGITKYSTPYFSTKSVETESVTIRTPSTTTSSMIDSTTEFDWTTETETATSVTTAPQGSSSIITISDTDTSTFSTSTDTESTSVFSRSTASELKETRTEPFTFKTESDSRTEPFTSETMTESRTASEVMTKYSTPDVSTKMTEIESTITSTPSMTTKSITDFTSEFIDKTSEKKNPTGTIVTKFTAPPRSSSSTTTEPKTSTSTDTKSTNIFSTVGITTETELGIHTSTEASSETASEPLLETSTSEPVSESRTETYTPENVTKSGTASDATSIKYTRKYSTPDFSTKIIGTESITSSTPMKTENIDSTTKFIDRTSITKFTPPPPDSSSISTASEIDTSTDTESTTLVSTTGSTTESKLATDASTDASSETASESRVEFSTSEKVSESRTEPFTSETMSQLSTKSQDKTKYSTEDFNTNITETESVTSSTVSLKTESIIDSTTDFIGRISETKNPTGTSVTKYTTPLDLTNFTTAFKTDTSTDTESTTMFYTSGSSVSELMTGISTEASPEIVSEPRIESSTSEIVSESQTDPFTSETVSETGTASESVTTYSTQDFTTKKVETELTHTSMPSTSTKGIVDSTTEIFDRTSGTQNPSGTSATKFTVPNKGTSSITTASETDTSTDIESTTMLSTAGLTASEIVTDISTETPEIASETHLELSTSELVSESRTEPFTSETVSEKSTASESITEYSTKDFTTKSVEIELTSTSMPATTAKSIIDSTTEIFDRTGTQNPPGTSVTKFTVPPQGSSSIITASGIDTSTDTKSTTAFSTAGSTTESELLTETRVESSTFEPVSESSTISDGITKYTTPYFSTKSVETDSVTTGTPSTTTGSMIDYTTQFNWTSETQYQTATSVTKFTSPPQGSSSIITISNTDISTDTESTSMFSGSTASDLVTETGTEPFTPKTISETLTKSFTSETVPELLTASEIISLSTSDHSTKSVESESTTSNTPSTSIVSTTDFIDKISKTQDTTGTSVTNFTASPQISSTVTTASDIVTSTNTESITVFSPAGSTTESVLVTETRTETSTSDIASETDVEITSEPVSESRTASEVTRGLSTMDITRPSSNIESTANSATSTRKGSSGTGMDFVESTSEGLNSIGIFTASSGLSSANIATHGIESSTEVSNFISSDPTTEETVSEPVSESRTEPEILTKSTVDGTTTDFKNESTNETYRTENFANFTTKSIVSIGSFDPTGIPLTEITASTDSTPATYESSTVTLKDNSTLQTSTPSDTITESTTVLTTIEPVSEERTEPDIKSSTLDDKSVSGNKTTSNEISKPQNLIESTTLAINTTVVSKIPTGISVLNFTEIDSTSTSDVSIVTTERSTIFYESTSIGETISSFPEVSTPVSVQTSVISDVTTSILDCTCENCSIVDTSDCTKYIECNNGLKVSMQCPVGFLYNDIINKCDFAENVVCNSKLVTCPSADGFYANVEDCRSYIQCYQRISYRKMCPEGLFYNPLKRTCDLMDNCGVDPVYPTLRNSDVTCACENCIMPDSENCSRYYLCLNGTAFDETCGSNLEFNPEISTCDYPENVQCASGSTRCLMKNGYFKANASCSRFYHCVGGVAYPRECETGKHFSETTKRCEDPCDALCDSSLDCTESTTVPSMCLDPNGIYPHPTDCQAFYKCTKGEPILSLCIGDEHFNPRDLLCQDPCLALCDSTIDCSNVTNIPTSDATEEPFSISTTKLSTTITTVEETNYDTRDFDKITSKSDFTYATSRETDFTSEVSSTPFTPSDNEISNTSIVTEVTAVKDNTKIETSTLPTSFETFSPIRTTETAKTTSSVTESSIFMSTTSEYDIDTTESPISNVCQDPNGLYPSSNNCRSFIKCIAGEPYEKQCDEEFHFSPLTLRCELPCIAKCDPTLECSTTNLPIATSPVPFIKCPQKDFFPVFEQCDYFFDCVGRFPRIQSCPSGLSFNATTRVCDWPENAECGSPIKPLPESDNSYDCPCETCLLPSTESCGAYHLCLNHKAYHMECSSGLLFDKYLSTCNHESNVLCDITSTTSTTTVIPSSTTQSQKCPERNGMFRDPTNCGRFIHCSNFWPYIKDCPGGLHFSIELQRCDWPCEAKCDLTLPCVATQQTPIPFRRPSTTPDPLCPCKNCRVSNPESCTKYIECTNGISKRMNCRRGQTFDHQKQHCDWAHKVDCPYSQICPRSNGLFLYKDDCHKFVHCANGIPYIKTCPEELEFDPRTLRCEWPSGKCVSTKSELSARSEGKGDQLLEGKWTCPEKFGYFPHETSCSKFYVCSYGTSYLQECPKDLSYNPIYQTCDWQKNVKCGSHHEHNRKRCRRYDRQILCPQNRTQVAHSHCDMFYDCSTGAPCPRRCPLGLFFNSITHICDIADNVNCMKRDGEIYSLRGIAETCHRKDKGQMQDPANDSCFYKCHNHKVIRGCCSRNRVFDEKSNNCMLKVFLPSKPRIYE